ncbi:MAG: hypothetical protein IJH60_01570 [Eubacterium sp.]|nr:hypothetical protein [Eubacterium sp.]
MSYDIRLMDPVTEETIELPVKHVMTGGTYQADYDERTGTFSPKPISEAWLNITYNYGHYYYEATDGDSRFAHDKISAYYADGTTGPVVTEYGIRGIYGKSGAESIRMLEDMIKRIENKYKVDGKWIITNRKRKRYRDKDGKEVDVYYAIHHPGKCSSEDYTEDISEGPCADYWEPTAANAMKPLYQLLAMARLRPDGVWDGD